MQPLSAHLQSVSAYRGSGRPPPTAYLILHLHTTHQSYFFVLLDSHVHKTDVTSHCMISEVFAYCHAHE